MSQVICNIRTGLISSSEVYLIESFKKLSELKKGFAIFDSSLVLRCSIDSTTLLGLKINKERNIKPYFEKMRFEIVVESSVKEVLIDFELFEKIVEKYPSIEKILFSESLLEKESSIELFENSIINPCFRIEGSRITLLDFDDKIYLKIWNLIDMRFKTQPNGLKQATFYEEWEHSRGRRFAF